MVTKAIKRAILLMALLQCTGGRKEGALPSYGIGFAGVSAQSRSPEARITIAAGATIDDVVKANPAGSAFLLAAGVYRMQSVTPKDGDSFVGQPGTIMNGARQLTSFVRSDNYWVAAGQTQHGKANGKCLPAYSGCEYPEDLFFNNVPLQRVESLSLVTPGKWYFDYSAGKVYFVDDPTDKTVEISVTPRAFSGSAASVTIKGLIIEKYANPAQDGPISCFNATNVCLAKGWTIEANEIRLNHGAAIRLATNQVIKSNYIHHNGQEGLTGSGSNIQVQNNEIAYNNALGFDFAWEAGGTKFSNMDNLIVQGNYVHDNKGPGLSLDYQCYKWVIQGNRASNNYVAGILDEISYDGIARYNVIQNDGLYPGKANPSMWWACAIQVLDSLNANIYGNTLINNSNGICAVSAPRGSGNKGEFLVKNLSVHDNVIVQTSGSAAGAVAQAAKGGYYLDVYSPSWNNQWTTNTYRLSNPLGIFYIWKGGSGYTDMNPAQWKLSGQDTDGSWIPLSVSTFPSNSFAPARRLHTLMPTEVWRLPATNSSLTATEPSGANGTVTHVAGPILSGGLWWWNVKFDDGTEGWSQETSLGVP
jgi:hypothetical protein